MSLKHLGARLRAAKRIAHIRPDVDGLRRFARLILVANGADISSFMLDLFHGYSLKSITNDPINDVLA